MALIDITDLLIDPDFTNEIPLIRRAATVNEWGENVLTETVESVIAIVQGPNTEFLERFPQMATLNDAISVWYKGTLTAESAGGYADVIIWNGLRYQVKEVAEDYSNWGAGWTMALCQLEQVNRDG